MTSTDTLQAWLALEHEAVWLHPVVGARFDQLAAAARASYSAHQSVRDALLTRLHALGVEPVATQLSYDVGPLTTLGEARKAAQSVETAIAATCLTLVGETSGPARTNALKGLTRAARAELTWGGQAKAFPGLP